MHISWYWAETGFVLPSRLVLIVQLQSLPDDSDVRSVLPVLSFQDVFF